jgi:3-oxoacyl-[acyl-carrier protein] reductase
MHQDVCMRTYLEPGTAILVTGASGGIGYEIARRAAECGAVVGVHASSQGSVDDALSRLRADVPGATLVGVPANFHEEGVPARLVESFVSEAGKLDALVHCAITGAPGTTGLFQTTQPENYGPMISLVLGVFQQLSHAALAPLKATGGTIVALVSDAGRYPAARQSVIGAAAGGIIAFVKNLAFEEARDRVRAHVISLSYVKDTPVFERFGAGGRGEAAEAKAGLGLPTPQDIAPLVLFLCGPDAARMTGQVLSINGGINTA